MTAGDRHLAPAAILLSLIGLGCVREHPQPSTSVPFELGRVSATQLFDEGVAYALRGDSLRAEQYLNAARERGYSSDSIVVWLVRVCIASSRFQAALLHVRQHLTDHPANWWLRYVAASIHDALGDVGNARAQLEMVVAAAPELSLPHYRLGLLYLERLDEPELSVSHFREYLRLAPHGEHADEVRALIASESSTSSWSRSLPGPITHDLRPIP